MALAVGVGLVWTAAKVAVPRLVQAGIDQGVVPGDRGALLRWTVDIGAAGVVAGACTSGRRYWAFYASRRVESDLRERLYAHVQRQPFAFHDRTPTGQLMARGSTDLQQINFLFAMLPLSICNTVIVVAVGAVLLLSEWRLALLVLSVFPLLSALARRFAARLHPSVTALQQELAELSDVVEESVAGVRVIKGFGAEGQQAARLRTEADDVFRRSVEAAGVRAAYLPAMELLPGLALVGVLWYGGTLALRGSLSAGQLVSFMLYVQMLVWPLRSTGLIVSLAQRAAASADRLVSILGRQPEVVDRPGARSLPPGRGEVRFEGVRFAYPGSDRPVLDGLHLHVPAGQRVALVGATGAGKTTLTRLLPRFYEVDEGRVLLDGVDVRDVRLADLRRAVATAFEDTFLFSDTLRTNVAFARPEATADEVARAASLAGAAEFVERLPDGYATLVGERGYSLSGGQRQRLALARAIAAAPRVLILDDATSAVDATTERAILAALQEVMAGRTTLVIAHRPATLALVERVVLLAGGRVAADGTHHELLAGSEAYRQVLAAWAAEEGRGRERGDGHADQGGDSRGAAAGVGG